MRNTLTPLRLGVLRLMHDEPGLFFHQMADRLGTKSQPIANTFSWLRKEGYITAHGVLTEAGEQLLAENTNAQA